MKAKHPTLETKTLRERTGRPVIDHDNLSHDQTMVNEANMDFRIPGLPHSVVKHAQSTSVRELIQKIETHPDRHALQQDLRQNQAYNPFSPESKKMIQDVGNIELCELLETEPKNAVHSMPIILEHRHRLLHMRAFLAERNSGQSKIRQIYDGPSFTPRACHQEERPHGHRYGKKARRQRILSGSPIEEEMQKRNSPKESMTDSYEIMNSVLE